MEQILIIGVDVSKSSLDIYVKPTVHVFRIDNRLQGFNQWLRELRKICTAEVKMLVVMEHTGQYSYRFESFLRANSLDYCKIAALQIKRSLGMIRGKTDKVDAKRIAEYGWLRREILVADRASLANTQQLKQLLGLRATMVKQRSCYKTRLKEMKDAGTCHSKDLQYKIQQQTINFLNEKISQVEKAIKILISQDEAISKTCQLLRSIKGVGWITAAFMIGCTENFTRFTDARKFNCYAGLAPFAHQSGSSIKGRARVSHLANKKAKALLNLAASSAIQHNPEMKEYYQRRVAEGKRKMSCLNIIRSKLVARMFAVIKRQTPYQQLAPAA